MIQIQGNVRFRITLDPSTWIFDDRKVTIEEMEAGKISGVEPISFKDNKAWNRDILEGGAKPPTLNSEKKYKKQQLLESTYVINLEPFIKITEPAADATVIRLSNGSEHEDIRLEDVGKLFFQFSKDGKRLYADGMVDAFLYDGEYSQKIEHVNAIEVI
ncbi:hypothetical protein [Macrococcus carouselicus]|uniref:Peptidyl-prolyl cis-trans isomerase n=1 Tax=Macrococcus carouselicus TaxID=69969 RepID=A0A9Q8FRF4_9STAP|nr:hypothetical protein [Macrococcus carouselicus]TDM04718.1 hypothetical protein ERX40_01710 [Macrococcus carouselicus]